MSYTETLWTVSRQAPQSMGFSRHECWTGVPCPPPEDLSDPGIKSLSLASPAMQVNTLLLSHQGSPIIKDTSCKTVNEKCNSSKKITILNLYGCGKIALKYIKPNMTLPVHHQLPEFTQTHVHRVSDAIQPSHPLSSPSPAPNPSQLQSLFQ